MRSIIVESIGEIEVPDDFFEWDQGRQDDFISGATAKETVPEKAAGLIETGKEKVDEVGEKAAVALEGKLDQAKAKADEFASQLGEDRFWNAVVEYAAGKSTEGAVWVLENFGKELADILIFIATWHPKAGKLIPDRRLRTVVQISSLFSLVGGSAIEGALRHFEKKGMVSPETVEWLNNNGIEPLEKLNLRSLFIQAFFGGNLDPEKQQKLDDYYNDPERGKLQQFFGKLYGSGKNKGGLIAI